MISRNKLVALLLIVFLIGAFSIFAEEKGELTTDLLKKYSENVKSDKLMKMRINALTSNNLFDLIENRDILSKYDFHFTKKLEMMKITNQNQSGRCWIYAALNVMRPEMAKNLNVKEFELSEAYLFFWDKLEKSNSYLERILASRDKELTDRKVYDLIRYPNGDGGWWNYAVGLIYKYGVVPKTAYEENTNTENTRTLNKILQKLLKKDAAILRKMAKEGKTEDELRVKKEEMVGTIYKVLVMFLNEPPVEFEYRYEDKDKNLTDTKTYTPKSFLETFYKGNLNDYVTFIHDPRRIYNKLFRIDGARNIEGIEDFTVINMDINDMKKLVEKSIMADEAVWFAADVGEESDRKKGILARDIYEPCEMIGLCIHMPKSVALDFDEISPNHAMAFTGVDIKDKKPVKWLVENSWGDKNGKNGYFVMYDDWFDAYVLNVVINKKYIDKDILKVLETEPTVLEEWEAYSFMLNPE